MADERRIKCPCCLRPRVIRVGQEWERRIFGAEARLRIVHPDKDGVIVEQVGRETIEPRWGISYRDLQHEYQLVAALGRDRP
jgi:hypothetical protein